MNELVVDHPVKVSDNGIRSFIPPTFCFVLTNVQGEVVTVVSRVEAAQISKTDFDAVEEFSRENLLSTGSVVDYDAGPQARVPGRAYRVTHVLKA